MRPALAPVAAVALVLLGGACDSGPAPDSNTGDATSAASTLPAPPEAPEPPPLASAPAEPSYPMPRPRRGRLGAAVALNATCTACHARQAAEWRASQHRQSNTSAAYQRAFAIEPTAFCRGCHAPEADPARAPPAAVSELGVGCVTCHVTEEGAVLAAASPGDAPDDAAARAPSVTPGPRAAPDPGAQIAPHGLRRSNDFARTGGCAGCHEFRFPAAHGDDDGDFMQTTVREHRRSSSAETACAACHMPVVDGRRSHAFAEVRDPAWLQSHLRVTAERSDDTTLRLTLTQTAPGHGFPSGDLFRRLEVGCELRGADGKVLSRDARYLARHFEILPGRPGRQLARDNRVFDEPVIIDLDLDAPPPGAAPARLTWWVTYQRVATVGAGTDPTKATIESEVPLHTGALPWETKQP